MLFAATPLPPLAHAAAAPQWFATTLLNLIYPVLAFAALATLVALVARRRRWKYTRTIPALCATPILTLALFWAAGQAVPAAIPPRAPSTTLRIAHLNSLYWNNQPASKAAFAMASGADVVSLVEASPQLHTSLQILAAHAYPYQAYTKTPSRRLHLNMLLLSRWPVTLVKSWTPRLNLYHIDRPGSPFYVLQLHPLSPSSPADLLTRNTQLGSINPAELPTPLIAVGDFNAAPWDPSLKPLLTVLHGQVWQAPTFPSYLPLTPIDHVLTSQASTQPTLHRIRVANTDHLALIADFPNF